MWPEHGPSLLEFKSYIFISRWYCSRSLHFEPIILSWLFNVVLGPVGRLSVQSANQKRSEPILQQKLDVVWSSTTLWNWYQSQLSDGMSEQGTKTPQKTNHGARTLISMATWYQSICERLSKTHAKEVWKPNTESNQPKQAFGSEQTTNTLCYLEANFLASCFIA